jgi:hypothetical protein
VARAVAITPGIRIRGGSIGWGVGGIPIPVTILVLPNLPDVAGQAIGTVIAKTIDLQVTIVRVGVTAGAAVAAVAIDEGVARITDKKAER